MIFKLVKIYCCKKDDDTLYTENKLKHLPKRAQSLNLEGVLSDQINDFPVSFGGFFSFICLERKL